LKLFNGVIAIIGRGGAGLLAAAGVAGATGAGGVAGGVAGMAAGAIGAAGVAGATAGAGPACIFFHSAAAKALSVSLSESIGIVKSLPSAFLIVIVRAAMSTAVISASMATPALFVHFRISAVARTGRSKVRASVKQGQRRTFIVGTVVGGTEFAYDRRYGQEQSLTRSTFFMARIAPPHSHSSLAMSDHSVIDAHHIEAL
jgi:hypothetical protein